MFYKVKYSPNLVSKKVTVDTSSDSEFSTLNLVQDGTKIEFFPVTVSETSITRFIAAYRNLLDAKRTMEVHGFDVDLPRSATFALTTEVGNKAGKLIVEDDLGDFEVFAHIHNGINGWYVEDISIDDTVNVSIKQNKILKYGLDKFHFHSPLKLEDDVDGVLVTDIMGDVEEFHKTQTDSDVDDRYSMSF